MSDKKSVLWATAALVAVGALIAVVVAAISSNRDSSVLSQQEVAAELAGQQAGDVSPAGVPDASTPSGTGAPDTALTTSPNTASNPALADGASAIARSQAGTLVVRCSGDKILLVRWSPNAGYRVDDVTRAPTQISVWFESDVANDVEAVVTCVNGRAVLTEHVEADDHGRGGGGDGKGSDD